MLLVATVASSASFFADASRSAGQLVRGLEEGGIDTVEVCGQGGAERATFTEVRGGVLGELP